MLAVVGVLGLAVAMAVLPVLVALWVLGGTGAMRSVVVGIASLVAIAGGARLAAAIAGLARSASFPRKRISTASVD